VIALLREATIGVGIFIVAVWFLWGTCYCLWKANGGK
jgi:hypothetical protein